MNSSARVIDRGRGPEIEGTRVTVYVILEYLHAGRDVGWIASNLRLSSPQVQAAIDYIDEHRDDVETAYAKARQRIEEGNPSWVDQRLKEKRARFEAFADSCRNRNGLAEAPRDAGNHVRQ